ncbi:cell division protein CrgA [Jatrophihabitans sp.]|uniref:cell division protein CrgA n=1 Tax=Jatrophihabitans sp. TaxID=1932789 RepID=UPI002F20E2D7
MPKSKVRKNPNPQPSSASGPRASSGGAKMVKPSPPWYPVLMAAFLLIGLAYIVVYYMAAESIPFMNSLGSWNFAVGFGFLIVGLGLAVRWR